MARGFESKSVAHQQELADERPRGPRHDVDPAALNKRRGIELALADVRRKLETAHAEGISMQEAVRRAVREYVRSNATDGGVSPT